MSAWLILLQQHRNIKGACAKNMIFVITIHATVKPSASLTNLMGHRNESERRHNVAII